MKKLINSAVLITILTLCISGCSTAYAEKNYSGFENYEVTVFLVISLPVL